MIIEVTETNMSISTTRPLSKAVEFSTYDAFNAMIMGKQCPQVIRKKVENLHKLL